MSQKPEDFGSSTEKNRSRDSKRIRGTRIPTLFLVAIPFVLLTAFAAFLLTQNLTEIAGSHFPPIEELVFERIILQKASNSHSTRIMVHFRNDGPDPVTIAQVQVDKAYWYYTMTPEDHTLNRLQTGVLNIPYHWVEGDMHEITLVTSSGATFSHEIPVAVESPFLSTQYFGFFALIGFYVGIVPIVIGLLWFPLLGRLSVKAWHFILFLTIGLLVFLGIDTAEEGLEMAHSGMVAESFQPAVLFFVVAIAVYLLLQVISERDRIRSEARGKSHRGLSLAYMVALGIGLHNLGEGLAIGAAYSAGELSLGASLVIGFALHNTTEGLAIISPLAKESFNWKQLVKHLALLGLLAGAPTICGAWVGSFAFSPFWGVVFLAVGTGAIFQVVYAISAQIIRDTENPVYLFNWTNLAGLTLGFTIMLGTALLV